MSDIVIKNLSKSFGEKKVIENYSHIFKQGSRTCIMGASGRGKTTLLNLLSGIIKPDKGEITGIPEDVSVVFQEDRLSEPFSAVANVLAVTDKSVTKSDAANLLSELGLGDSLYLPVSSFSGGMKRRVAIARALLAKSQLLLFDEPFKGLDDKTKEAVIKTVLKYGGHKTLLVATHDAEDAKLLSAEILEL